MSKQGDITQITEFIAELQSDKIPISCWILIIWHWEYEVLMKSFTENYNSHKNKVLRGHNQGIKRNVTKCLLLLKIPITWLFPADEPIWLLLPVPAFRGNAFAAKKPHCLHKIYQENVFGWMFYIKFPVKADGAFHRFHSRLPFHLRNKGFSPLL